MKHTTYSKHDIETKKISMKPGNFVVTHHSGFMDSLIHFFTRSRWNHAALVIASDGTLIELQTHGIQKRNIDTYPVEDYFLIDIEMSDEDRQQAVAYAQFMLKKHEKYGFLTVATIALKIVTHSRLVIKLDGTLICSEFVANALSVGGIIWDKDTSLITPADLYRRFV
jgi:hypothetical protein